MDTRTFVVILVLYSFVAILVLYSFVAHFSDLPSPAASEDASSEVSQLLVDSGLPAGLFPKNAVTKYDLDGAGRPKVYLDRPILAKYENRVFYDRMVKANLTRGALIGVEGLAQEELFLWLPVIDIYEFDPASGLILFDNGVAHKEMALSIFEEPRACTTPQGLHMAVDAEDGTLQSE